MTQPAAADDGEARPTRLCLIRHGETDWNAEQRIQGQTDIPLNRTGQTQARALADTLSQHHFSAVYSSDLSRARETARLIAAPRGLEVRCLPALRERHYGLFQGLTQTQGAHHHPALFARYSARDPHCDFHTGESLLTLTARVMAGLAAMVQPHRGQTICAVCHAGVLDIIYRQATGRPLQSPRDFAITHCTPNWLRQDGAGWQVEQWATQGHLTPSLLPTPE